MTLELIDRVKLLPSSTPRKSAPLSLLSRCFTRYQRRTGREASWCSDRCYSQPHRHHSWLLLRCHSRWACWRQRRGDCPVSPTVDHTSVCSAISSASSTSIPGIPNRMPNIALRTFFTRVRCSACWQCHVFCCSYLGHHNWQHTNNMPTIYRKIKAETHI
jgi:hypothetical protein